MPKWTLTPEEDRYLQDIFEGRQVQHDAHVQEYYYRRRAVLAH